MSDLSRSLIDAAARLIRDVYEELPDGSRGGFTEVQEWHGEARAAVAVLETLATHTGPARADGPVRVQFLNHEEFKRLAAEVKGEQV
jgi:hypothetical protein